GRAFGLYIARRLPRPRGFRAAAPAAQRPPAGGGAHPFQYEHQDGEGAHGPAGLGRFTIHVTHDFVPPTMSSRPPSRDPAPHASTSIDGSGWSSGWMRCTHVRSATPARVLLRWDDVMNS